MSLFSLLTGSFRNRKIADAVFVEKHPYEKGFSAHYEKYLKPHVEKFEEKRLEALKEASYRLKVSIPGVILAIFASFMIVKIYGVSEDSIRLGFFIVLFALMAASYWIYISINKYAASIKSDIFPNILSFLGDYHYFPLGKSRMVSFKDSAIIPKLECEINKDEIVGEYKGVGITILATQFRSCEFFDEEFKGIAISLDMNKKFLGKTIVKHDKGGLINWLSAKRNKDLDNVKLEDPLFEKIFEVYSNDQVEARYLLTTSFMQRLLNLKDSFGGEKVECSFYDESLFIMIPVKKNLFEPGPIYESEDFVDDAQNVLKEMNDIFQIIDLLKLDQKTSL